MRFGSVITMVALAAPALLAAQAATQNATLRRANSAYDNLQFSQALTFARQALGERLTAPERARALEIMAVVFGSTNQPDSAINAFREMIALDPDRELGRVSGRIGGYFQAALSQVLVVRQLRVDSSEFVAGQGFLPIRYTITSSARVRTRAVSGPNTVLLDSSVTSGQVNLRWNGQLAGGQPAPAGDWTIVVEAQGAGQNSYSASQQVRLTHGPVDTLPHLTALPGYEFLPETEIPPKSFRPLGLATLYTGAAAVGAFAFTGELGSSQAPLFVVGVGAALTGIVKSLSKPAPQPARANILYNRLLREQVARRNQEIARENVQRRQAVELRMVPIARAGGAR